MSSHTYSGTGASVYYVDVTVTGRTSPMLAIRTATAVYVERITVSGGSWTWRILSYQDITFDWFCFDLSSGESVDTFGMEVFNSAGVRVYHSSHKPLRIAGIYDYGDGDGATYDSVASITLTSGRSYAVVQLAQGFGEWYQDDGADQRMNWYSGFEAGTAFIRYARVRKYYVSGNTGGGVDEQQIASLMAVDVTDY